MDLKTYQRELMISEMDSMILLKESSASTMENSRGILSTMRSNGPQKNVDTTQDSSKTILISMAPRTRSSRR